MQIKNYEFYVSQEKIPRGVLHARVLVARWAGLQEMYHRSLFVGVFLQLNTVFLTF